MSERASREIRLRSRPSGVPTNANFELAEVTVPDPQQGEVLVQNLCMSVDPYMRGRMVDRKSYVPPFQVGEVMQGGAVGRVVESKNDEYDVGDHVLSPNGWREYFLSSGADIQRIDGRAAPASAFLGILGMPGLTAHYGLLEIGKPAPGRRCSCREPQALWGQQSARSPRRRAVGSWAQRDPTRKCGG